MNVEPVMKKNVQATRGSEHSEPAAIPVALSGGANALVLLFAELIVGNASLHLRQSYRPLQLPVVSATAISLCLATVRTAVDAELESTGGNWLGLKPSDGTEST